MRAAGISVRAFEQNTERAGVALRKSGHHGFWFNQAMFTIRRTIYGLTLALGALTASAAVMGFQFQSTMEQNRLAFTRFLGSEQEADRELAHLFELAAKTPFEFTQIVDATRKFLAFGYTLDETNELLGVTADAVAGFGLSAEAIDRAVLALGQMRSAGRVLGQDLRQLQELGLFSPEDFGRRLNLPEGYLGNVGNLMIPSKPAVDAITAYWREKFGGASADFATTFKGQLTTLRDYGSRTFGAMIEPLYQRLSKDILPAMIKVTIAAQEGFESGGMKGFFEAIDRGVGHGLNLAGTWALLIRTAKALWGVIKPLAEAFYFAYQVLRPTLAVFLLVLMAVESLGSLLQAFSPLLKLFITLWIVERTVLLLATVAGWRHITMRKAEVLWTKRAQLQLMLYNWWQITSYAWSIRQSLGHSIALASMINLIKVYRAAVIWTKVLTVATIRLVMWMAKNPWTLALIAIVLIERKFHILENTIKRTIADIKLMIHWVKKLANLGPNIDPGAWGKSFRGWVGGLVPGMASGGRVTSGGFAMVGERGPELGYFPRGAAVAPLEAPSLLSALGDSIRGQQGDVVIPITLELDGREMAKKTVRYRHKVAAVT